MPPVVVVPQFPLGTVLFPHMVLPLHVFEERYRRLARHVLDGDHEFGVPLIERGSEVGGGDVRSDVGTVARVVQAEELPDGRFGLLTVGVRRFRVRRWLEDDPYPRAEIEDWPDEDVAVQPAQIDHAVGVLRRTLALASELGHPTPPLTLEVSSEPSAASFQVATLAPLGPLDKQALLRAPSAAERLALVVRALDELAELLALRLASEDPSSEP